MSGRVVPTGPRRSSRGGSAIDSDPVVAARAIPIHEVPLPRTLSIDALPVLLTMVEVAALLRTSRKAIYAMAERNQLAGVTRIGRRLLVRRDDLLSWLDERRAASPGGTRR